MSERFILQQDRWYGWQMLPGYSSGYDPYFSPIFLEQVEPKKTGEGWLRLNFFNAGYAKGVQDFGMDIRVLDRRRSYLVASIPPDRNTIISEIDFQWLRDFTHLDLPSQGGSDWSACQAYLTERFFRSPAASL